jgi:hypothetical protein
VSPDQIETWRARLAAVNPLVGRPVSASGSFEAALEVAWLHERLEEYPAAVELYEELVAAVRDMSSLLTGHELEIAWSRTGRSLAQALAIIA